MSHPDEGMIHAWLDGELGPDEAAALTRRVAADPVFAAAVAEARGLIAASSRIVGALDAVPGGVIPAGSSAAPALRRRGNRGFRVEPWMGIAAALVLTVGTAIVSWPTDETEPGPVGALTDAPPAAAQAPTSVSPAPVSVAPESPASARAGERVANSSVAPSARAELAEREGTETVALPASVDAASPVVPLRAPPTEKVMSFQDRSDDRAALSGVVVTGASDAAAGAPAGRAAAPPPTAPRVAAMESRSLQRERNAELPLFGCWRVAPPLVDVPDTLLRDPKIVSRRGDTLSMLVSARRQVTAVQNGDTLRGELNATRVECPPIRPPEPE